MSASAIACFSFAYAWSRSEAEALIGPSDSVRDTGRTSVCVSEDIDKLLSQFRITRCDGLSRPAARIFCRHAGVAAVFLRTREQRLRHGRDQPARGGRPERQDPNSQYDQKCGSHFQGSCKRIEPRLYAALQRKAIYSIYQKQKTPLTSLRHFGAARNNHRLRACLGLLRHVLALLDQRQHGVDHRRRLANQTADFLHNRQEGVDFHRPPRFEILKHRRLGGADSASTVESLLPIDPEMHAALI